MVTRKSTSGTRSPLKRKYMILHLAPMCRPSRLSKRLSETPRPKAAARANSEFPMTQLESLIIAVIIDSGWSGWSSGTQRPSRGTLAEYIYDSAIEFNVAPESIIKALSGTPSPEAAARANSEFLGTHQESLITSLIIDSGTSGWSSGTHRPSRGTLEE